MAGRRSIYFVLIGTSLFIVTIFTVSDFDFSPFWCMYITALLDHDLPLQCLLDLPLCFHLVSFYKSWLVQYTATGGQCYQVADALMYVLVPMPCMFFGGGSTEYLLSRDGGGWIDAAKFLTGASAVGSIAIPIILKHAHLISTGAMLIEFMSFFIFVGTVMCFHRANLEDEW